MNSLEVRSAAKRASVLKKSKFVSNHPGPKRPGARPGRDNKCQRGGAQPSVHIHAFLVQLHKQGVILNLHLKHAITSCDGREPVPRVGAVKTPKRALKVVDSEGTTIMTNHASAKTQRDARAVGLDVQDRVELVVHCRGQRGLKRRLSLSRMGQRDWARRRKTQRATIGSGQRCEREACRAGAKKPEDRRGTLHRTIHSRALAPSTSSTAKNSSKPSSSRSAAVASRMLPATGSDIQIRISDPSGVTRTM